MATPKKAPETVPVYRDDDVSNISLDNLPPAPELDDEEVMLSNVLADLGGESDGKVNVYRKIQGKADEFVATYAPAAFSLEDLQASYGGGQYHVHVRANGRLVARRIVNIAVPIKPLVPVGAPAAETEKILTTMQQGFQSMGQMLLESVKAIVQNQQPQKSTADLLKELVLMKEILGGNETRQPDPMESMMRHFEFFKQLNPSDREPGTMDAILEGLKTLGPALAQGITQPRQVPVVPVSTQVNPVSTAPNAASVVAVSDSLPTPESDPMSLAQTMYINMLVQNAKNDPDFDRCETYANMMLDMLGDDAARQVLDMPDWFDKLVAVNPEAANYRPWFDRMREIAIELTAIEEDDTKGGTDSPGQSLNADQQPAAPESTT